MSWSYQEAPCYNGYSVDLPRLRLNISELLQDLRTNSMPAKQQTERDAMVGNVYFSRPDKGGDKAPFFKGFVGVSKEMLRVLLEQEEDDYGSVKLEIAVWKKDGQPGVLSGKAQLPYALRQKLEESKSAPTSRDMPSKKVKEYAAELAEAVSDEDDAF